MAQPTPKPEPSALNIGNIAYVLFKYKWVILITTVLAVASAAVYYFRSGAVYQSEAKLMVRYLVDRNNLDRVDNMVNTSAEQLPNESIILAQMEILNSWDLAQLVARNVGAEYLISGSQGPAKEETETPATQDTTAAPPLAPTAVEIAAASKINKGLTVTVGKGSNVIGVAFKHSDPRIAKKVLDELVTQYLKKHLAIYRSPDAAKLVGDKVQKSLTNVKAADETLKQLRTAAKILSLPEAVASLNAERVRARLDLSAAETQLAEQQARVKAIDLFMPGGKGGPDKTGSAAVPAHASAEPPQSGLGPKVPEATPRQTSLDVRTAVPVADNGVVAKYQLLRFSLSQTQTKNIALLSTYKPGSEGMKGNEALIAQLETQIREMESKHPDLLINARTGGSDVAQRLDPLAERTQLQAIEARAEALRKNLADVESKVEKLSADTPALAQAERARDLEEGNYKYMGTSLEKAQVDASLNPTNIPNITIVQTPTPAFLDDKERTKIVLGIAAGGPALAVGLVLLFGLSLNRTVKRPQELEDRFSVPLMMSIPYFSPRKRLREARKNGGTEKLLAKGKLESTPWRQSHFIRPFAEAIRDRLGLYFERNRLTHKPKLIGVTGFAEGAGVSTFAGGLAAALSEIGESKVLLVDMNVANGKAHKFAEGLPVISLNKALTSEGQLDPSGDNLFLARADSGANGAGSLLLKRLFEVLPNLKASDFDYMVFDLPPLGQTSPSAAMGSLMDTVLVVVESERNSPEEIKRGYRDLFASGANVSAIFNKARAHGPKTLVGSF